MAPRRCSPTPSPGGSSVSAAALQQDERKRREMSRLETHSSSSGSSSAAVFSNICQCLARTAAVCTALVICVVCSVSSNSRSEPGGGVWCLTAAAATEAPDVKEDEAFAPKLTDAKLAELLQMELPEIQQRMEALFALIDANEDGKIDAKEAKEWSLKLKSAMHRHQVEMEYKAIDKDNDGKVSFEELAATYVSGTDQKQLEEHKEEVLKRFEAVDKDGNKLLDFEEVMLLMDPGKDDTLMQLEIDEILATQDKNKDNKITLQEFIETEGGNVSEAEKQELQKEFSAYDLDKDGSIDTEELRKIIKDPHAHEIDTLLEEFSKELADGVLPKSRWVQEYQKFAVSMLTDNGEVLRFPEDYKGITFPFSTSAGTEATEKDKEHDEL